jgi:holin-like protein
MGAKDVFKKFSTLILQLLILWFIYWISNELVEFTSLPIPGNVIGVIMLFGLLASGIIKIEYIKEGADFLLKHLVFFFIPITVGLMNWGNTFYDYGIELAVAITVSTLLPFWIVGYLTQFLHKKGKKCSN